MFYDARRHVCLHLIPILVAGCKSLQKFGFKKWHKWKRTLKICFDHELCLLCVLCKAIDPYCVLILSAFNNSLPRMSLSHMKVKVSRPSGKNRSPSVSQIFPPRWATWPLHRGACVVSLTDVTVSSVTCLCDMFMLHYR